MEWNDALSITVFRVQMLTESAYCHAAEMEGRISLHISVYTGTVKDRSSTDQAKP
jgi:hypothetical protein